jgi:hypothetical protein
MAKILALIQGYVDQWKKTLKPKRNGQPKILVTRMLNCHLKMLSLRQTYWNQYKNSWTAAKILGPKRNGPPKILVIPVTDIFGHPVFLGQCIFASV